MKIIIIGSGIAGLTLAFACQKRGIEVIVYEKAKSLQNIGGGILLWPHGLRYLDWLGLSHILKKFYVPVQSYDVIGHRGKKIHHESYQTLYQQIDGSILPIARCDLQNSLAASLFKNTIKFSKKCLDIVQDDKKAQVFFTDGTHDSADFIVGADGIYSTVRQKINPKAIPYYTNYAWWGGIFNESCAPFLSLKKAYIALGLTKLCIIWPKNEKQFMWYLPVKIAKENLISKEKNLEQLQGMCSEWHKDIHKIVFASSHSQRFYFPIYALAPQDYWTQQRIILIGDAAHALGPILGQGASQAIEDVFILSHFFQHIRRQNDFSADLFKYYEALRREKYLKLAELETQAAATLIHEEINTLNLFEQHIDELQIVNMYLELIPYINKQFCHDLASHLTHYFN